MTEPEFGAVVGGVLEVWVGIITGPWDGLVMKVLAELGTELLAGRQVGP